MSNLNQTPYSERVHIGIFGKRNSGKSSLINAITNQEAALVSDIAGTTTDPVYKAMEVRDIGPCVFIDTAGFDDEGKLGDLRVRQTELAVEKTDIAIIVITDQDFSLEKEWAEKFFAKKTPFIPVINKSDLLSHEELYETKKRVKKEFKTPPIVTSINKKSAVGIDDLLKKLVKCLPSKSIEEESLTGHLIKQGDTVLLVMPQDSEAPKGRLILPQVQTIRDLLDNGCVVSCCTEKNFKEALSSLSKTPDLIITDSQVFPLVYEQKPKGCPLTSFSVIMAGHKGDIATFVDGANAIDKLNKNSHILIAESCTHAPLSEDIGRVKIPAILRKRFGEGIKIDIVGGANFPVELKKYSLIIHCGGCMFNKKHILSRIERANNAKVPITNYGVALAKLNGILDKIVY